MRYVLILIVVTCVACQKKTIASATCEHKTTEYTTTLLNDKEIADRASAEMAAGCEGPYNIEEISQSEKRVIYRYSCPNKCK